MFSLQITTTFLVDLSLHLLQTLYRFLQQPVIIGYVCFCLLLRSVHSITPTHRVIFVTLAGTILAEGIGLFMRGIACMCIRVGGRGRDD